MDDYSLALWLDQPLLAILRDGRKLVGILRSYDQFSNLVFQNTKERVYHGNYFADIDRGIFLVRGENLVFLGLFSSVSEINQKLVQVEIEQLLNMQGSELEKKEKIQKAKERILIERGYGIELESELL